MLAGASYAWKATGFFVEHTMVLSRLAMETRIDATANPYLPTIRAGMGAQRLIGGTQRIGPRHILQSV